MWRGVDGGKGGSCGWTEAVYEACFRVSLKHASLWAEIFRKLRLKGLQMEMIWGKFKGGWTEVVYEACFRVSLKHASLWAEIFRKLRLKGLQMEMILGERGVVVGGQRSCTKHVAGLVSNMLRVSLKHASLWAEIFRKLRLKGLQMEMILGEMGVVVGGQRSCTKHVSGLVSNMLRCGLEFSRK